ncbi:MAG TPA: long-chain fatty acid--CoA ligase [Candidatus Omnitrophota bacterium]|nr:long-chain fatty acid--CoA ligase [Candidatus Omnitrophota bacterium]HPS37079.1 long-chain fatty acid--CoA ligase [Candidatus Omnitrophota bacterium]
MALKRLEFPPDDIEENGNLLRVFLHRARFFGQKKALFYKVDGVYAGSYTWQEWRQAVRETAMGLFALGVRKGDTVGIFSENCPEWTFADLGALSLGAVTVPLYPTSSAEDVRHIIEHSGLRVLFVSSEELYQKVLAVKPSLLAGGLILFFLKGVSGAETLAGLRQKGRLTELNRNDLYERCVESVGADDLATLIYTSGTTGAPKGVMLTHRNFIANYQGSWQSIQIDDRDSVLSFLPLSHVFERLAGYYYQFAYGVSIAYAENPQTVTEDIRKVRPTIVTAVPRFYEKVHARILEKVRESPPWRQALFHWAVRIGTRTAQMKIRKTSVPGWLAFYNGLAKYLVFNKLKNAMGGKIRFFISGGAPLSKDIARFFFAADVLILEGYGLTETSPVIAVNAPNDCRFGTVGKPIAGIRVKIAEDGEILTSGPCVMKGYYNQPDATAASIRDGWFHTGDIGSFDAEGFLRITDRKKDIIVTAGGKNVSPQNIELRILEDALFAQVIVIGDKRPYLCALIVPDKAQVMAQAGMLKLQNLPYEEILRRPEICEWVRMRLDVRMDGLAKYETVKAFLLLSREFTQAAGEVTQTLKIKRRVVMKEYHEAIEELYRHADHRWCKRTGSKV